MFPPRRRAREHSRRLASRAVVNLRQESERLAARNEPRLPDGLEASSERRIPARERHLEPRDREPIPVPNVDRLLRRPEARDRLAAAPHVVELRTHEGVEHAAPAMRRKHAHDGDTGSAYSSAGDRELERERARSSDDRSVGRRAVVGSVHALELEET